MSLDPTVLQIAIALAIAAIGRACGF